MLGSANLYEPTIAPTVARDRMILGEWPDRLVAFEVRQRAQDETPADDDDSWRDRRRGREAPLRERKPIAATTPTIAGTR